jgi:hypothetical protein
MSYKMPIRAKITIGTSIAFGLIGSVLFIIYIYTETKNLGMPFT